jgi:hypothetical protein
MNVGDYSFIFSFKYIKDKELNFLFIICIQYFYVVC